MPPYGSRRFDPYGPSTTTATTTQSTNPPGAPRQRTLISNNGNGRTVNGGGGGIAGRGPAGGVPAGAPVGSSSQAYGGGGPRVGGVGSTNSNYGNNNGSLHDRILQSAGVNHGGGNPESRGFSRGRSSGMMGTDSYVDNGRGRGMNDTPRGGARQPPLQSNWNGGGGVGSPPGVGGAPPSGSGAGRGGMPSSTRNVGAAPLSSQVHPLLASKSRGRSSGDIPFATHPDNDRKGGQRRGPSRKGGRGRRGASSSKTSADFIGQARRVLSILFGGQPPLRRDQKSGGDGWDDNEDDEAADEAALEEAKATARTVRLVLLFPVALYLLRKMVPSSADRITRPKTWRWSAGVSLPGKGGATPRRDLAGRNCVMNYFIEKQPPDEYDPDHVEIKPGEKDKDGKPKVRPPVKIVEGSYRTKGQVHVIGRFIEAVADSFRSNTNIRQHLIFAETRDGGHLAYEAVRHWPPRGKHRTTVHVIASDYLPKDLESQRAARALGYGSLEDIETRFRANDKARIYDRDGNVAGLPGLGDGNDDDETADAYEIEVPDRETLEMRARSGKNGNNRRRQQIAANNATLAYGDRAYPDIRLMLPFEEEDDGDGDVVVPYLHVDGVTMDAQMQVLESARSLLEEQTVVVVGVEHSIDLDVRKLIAYFREVKYKTFFLGARQVARIDNLCDEVLADVLIHPSVSAPTSNPFRRIFIKLGLISKDELRVVGKGTTEGPRKRETPPFFVAMPRGRRAREEMTIQHMYDLFGGYGGGGGQIKTANDRKAPGK